jgi:hypothetical protein
MDFAAKHERILATRREGTCKWFFQSPVVTNFIAHTETVLWAPGIRMWFASYILPWSQSPLTMDSWVG